MVLQHIFNRLFNIYFLGEKTRWICLGGMDVQCHHADVCVFFHHMKISRIPHDCWEDVIPNDHHVSANGPGNWLNPDLLLGWCLNVPKLSIISIVGCISSCIPMNPMIFNLCK